MKGSSKRLVQLQILKKHKVDERLQLFAWEKKYCRICKTPMHVEAIKCTKCGYFQNWRRFANVNATTIALLASTASILLALPNLIQYVAPQKSSVKGVLVGSEPNRLIHVMLINTGNAPAALGQLELKIPVADDLNNAIVNQKTYIGTLTPNSPTSVPGAGSVNVTYEIEKSVEKISEVNIYNIDDKHDCHLSASILNYNDPEPHSEVIRASCYSFPGLFFVQERG